MGRPYTSEARGFLNSQCKVRFSRSSYMDEKETPTPPKKRSLTSLTLGWIAERVRRAEELKEKVRSGSYNINSSSIAKALVDPGTEEKK